MNKSHDSAGASGCGSRPATSGLNILNQGTPCSGGGSCGGVSCGGEQRSKADSRRQFLSRATSMVFGSFALTLLPMESPESTAETPLPAPLNGGAVSAPPAASAAKPVLYGFLVDTEKCIGSGKCLSACRTENHVPDGYSRTWVERYVHFKDGTVQVDLVPEAGYHESTLPIVDAALVDKAYFVPKLCNQCVDAPCNQVCPVHASFTSPEGVELIDTDHCIGCGYCVQACPYGMRYINPETNSADKCTWCYHRITKNQEPACVEACPVGARVFGRLDDPESELSKRLGATRTQVLKEHLGTHPKLHYVGLSKEVV